ncbi:hypothetical protein EW145_g3360 [Phellinidium pouzarii]|uniref:Uncharacterized protein n=1 Tax=Phellinidium pouzarii TaxID=167371 RepID=A0A4S4L7L5_9AGAM|nr:hypothetical protein EW145_g3360 [Phellinidium pouzarii]
MIGMLDAGHLHTGSGGIGYATALNLARFGCDIAVHYNSARDKANALVHELLTIPGGGVRAEVFQADLSTYDGARALHADVVAKLGHPDVLFNNAGVTTKLIGPNGNIEDITPEMFEETWRSNTGTHYLLTQLCIPHMLEQNVAAGTGGVIGPHYASSKSAMHGLLHWIAMRYAKEGLTCNAVAPALITETTMFANPPEELRARIPVNRFGKPDEIASVVQLFVTNAYLTNKIIVVDGGWTPSAF